MRTRWPWLLLLLAGVVALAAWLVLDRGAADRQLLSGLNPDAIDRVLIQRPNTETVQLRRQHGEWWLQAPSEVSANDFHIRQMLNVARAQPQADYALADVEPERLGLDPPRVRLQLNDRVVLFGDTDAVDGLRYVQVDDRVLLIADRIMPLLEGAWWNLIDRRLLPSGRSLKAVETPHYRLQLEQDEWQAEPDIAVPASDIATDWRNVSALVVREVRRQEPDGADVRLLLDDGSSRVLRLDEEDGERRLVDDRRGLAYVFDGGTLDYLLRGDPESMAAEPIGNGG
ncbi:DUF4340 domain-containing protein [Methylonatrum kenyense]|uniref:DUF4340 domain-containing protein n=1 Tax=Methylonatrum kenyense TaxID=455253 RepID=UPI0020BF64DB|nr:DUF4340 domain-containing protein [Methylonatrum kenyense]MCK8516663.1 DUF4340 domain-containing protein [Methylonatrum kenyense]